MSVVFNTQVSLLPCYKVGLENVVAALFERDTSNGAMGTVPCGGCLAPDRAAVQKVFGKIGQRAAMLTRSRRTM